MQFAAWPLNTFVAPEIADFQSAFIPPLGGECSKKNVWIRNYLIHSVMGLSYNDTWKAVAVTFMSRTRNAISDYEEARALTEKFLANSPPEKPDINTYFDAVNRWESTLLNVQICLDLFLKVIHPSATVTDDGARIRLVANRVKHFAEDVADNKNAGATIPLWLCETGLKTTKAAVTYAELHENIEEMAKAAETIHFPGSSAP